MWVGVNYDIHITTEAFPCLTVYKTTPDTWYLIVCNLTAIDLDKCTLTNVIMTVSFPKLIKRQPLIQSRTRNGRLLTATFLKSLDFRSLMGISCLDVILFLYPPSDRTALGWMWKKLLFKNYWWSLKWHDKAMTASKKIGSGNERRGLHLPSICMVSGWMCIMNEHLCICIAL